MWGVEMAKLCREFRYSASVRLQRLFMFALVLMCLTSITNLRAHEFWIEPSTFQPNTKDTITADLVIGTDFHGVAGIYVPDEIEAFDLIVGTEKRQKITGRYGDRPAGKFIVEHAGMNIILHQTAPIYLIYSKVEKFDSFAREKGFESALASHTARGLSSERITERYQRFAKSLLAVGRGEASRTGEDRKLGLRFELVAETNPYALPRPEVMTVRLFEGANALAGAQVTVFTKHDLRNVTHQKYKTDAGGRVSFPLLPGRDYLVDSVNLLPLDDPDEPRKAVWESLWASLSFHSPAK